MATINFKYGLQSNLPSTLSEGTIYVTTDERSMWVDLPVSIEDGTQTELQRFRLGDFVSYKTLEELKNDYQHWNASTFAYIEEDNILAKYNAPEGGQGLGTWTHINNFKDIKDDINNIKIEIGKASNPDEEVEASGLYKLIEDEIARAIAAEETLASNVNDLTLNLDALDKEVGNPANAEEEIEASGLYKIIEDTKTGLIGGSTHESIKSLEDSLIGGSEYKSLKALEDYVKETEESLKSQDAALKEELENQIEQGFATADAMTFKGVITSINDLPTGEEIESVKVLVNAGDTYKVGQIITDTPEGHGAWYVGDLVIAAADQKEEDTSYTGGWYHISSGFEDDYSSYFSVDATNDKIVLKNAVEEDKGSISFVTNTQGLSIDVGADTENKAATISINLTWGTF